jgi:hypothetical protein
MSDTNDVGKNQPFNAALQRFREESRGRALRRSSLDDIVAAIRQDRESGKR